MEMSVTDREWVKFAIEGDIDAITGVRAAFLTHDGSPGNGDWVDAELDGATIRVLVGPGAHVLSAATYQPWTEITAPPELVRKPAPGTVRITP